MSLEILLRGRNAGERACAGIASQTSGEVRRVFSLPKPGKTLARLEKYFFVHHCGAFNTPARLADGLELKVLCPCGLRPTKLGSPASWWSSATTSYHRRPR